MTACFPDHHPGEILYSLAARHSDRVRYRTAADASAELFGVRGASAAVALPGRLGYLAAALPAGSPYTVDSLVDRHTLYPVYAAFLAPRARAYLRADMVAPAAGLVRLGAYERSLRVARPVRLRYCPSCTDDDRRSHGEAYWRRAHQVPGVDVCPMHETTIESSAVAIGSGPMRRRFVTAEEAIGRAPRARAANAPAHEALLGLARDATWLLDHPEAGPPAAAGTRGLHDRYRALLQERGCAAGDGSVDVAALTRAVTTVWPREVLARLGCPIGGRGGDNWLGRLAGAAPCQLHPLHHLIFLRALGVGAQALFDDDADHQAAPRPDRESTEEDR